MSKNNNKNSSSDGSDPTDSPVEKPKIKTVTQDTIIPKLPWLSRAISIAFLLIGTLAVGLLFYRVMAVFFVPLFIAAALVVIFRPVHKWFLKKVGNRKRVAAVCTTSLVLLIVLLPFALVITVAATQFTAMVSQVNLENWTSAIDRARDQFGLSLPHAEQFRRLDYLADYLHDPVQESKAEDKHQPIDSNLILKDIEEAKRLLNYLQDNVDGPPTAETYAEVATKRLDEFAEIVAAPGQEPEVQTNDITLEFEREERYHRPAVVASASIRAWMNQLLGGSFRSQARLVANPSEADFANLLRATREALQPRLVKFTGASGLIALQSIIGAVILIISVYFFLIDGPSMIQTLMRLSPLDDTYERKLLAQFDNTSRAVVLASLLSAIVQGILAAIAFYICGLKSVVLLFLLTSMMALIPFLGAASVWVPCAIYIGAVDQRWGWAIGLAIYGALVVSSIDNVIKAYVLHGHSQLHPLFALLSVLGGVQVFGPVGILVGPMVVVFLQTLLEILNHELRSNSEPMDVPIDELNTGQT